MDSLSLSLMLMELSYRSIEWMGCCCGGAENAGNGGEELQLPVLTNCFGSCP
uniref:Uncharacterized protein n=1 Tax=Nelumbo nucifera TaxID=4432 RepID=A0A822XZD4_NELNU|nr:TPA_asm: hypothetical protein HUJ06_027207 [Nelumbo nucifera]